MFTAWVSFDTYSWNALPIVGYNSTDLSALDAVLLLDTLESRDGMRESHNACVVAKQFDAPNAPKALKIISHILLRSIIRKHRHIDT